MKKKKKKKTIKMGKATTFSIGIAVVIFHARLDIPIWIRWFCPPDLNVNTYLPLPTLCFMAFGLFYSFSLIDT